MPEKLTLNTETLNAISGRLDRRADDIVMIACQDLAADLRLAAKIAARLVSLRSRITEIAEQTHTQALTNPEWKYAEIARDLQQALTDVEG